MSSLEISLKGIQTNIIIIISVISNSINMSATATCTLLNFNKTHFTQHSLLAGIKMQFWKRENQRGAGMAQWLSIHLPRRPPTNVARVRFPDSASNVGSRPCSKRFFSGYSKFQLDLEFEGHRFVSTFKYC